MTENVLKGKYNGGTIPIGFKVDEEKFFQVDPLKAPFVVEAFQRYNDGATMKELMNWLNDSGVTTNRNQKFTYNSQVGNQSIPIFQNIDLGYNNPA